VSTLDAIFISAARVGVNAKLSAASTKAGARRVMPVTLRNGVGRDHRLKSVYNLSKLL
jgi:hypothetical protein